jgi:transcriptional regulator with XRE-family HTH domain
MRLPTGTHNLRRLRELLGLKQDDFAKEIRISASMLQKLEHEQKPLKPRVAEDIADRTGISADWLLRNDPAEPPFDEKNRPYSRDRYARTQFTRRELLPALKPPFAVRALLLENYAKARDLFLRPEMYQHFLRYISELERLRMRFEEEAVYLEETTAAQLIDEDARQRNPELLYPSVIKDAGKCQRAIARERVKIEREKERRQSLGPLEPRGIAIIRKHIKERGTGRSSTEKLSTKTRHATL